jgi:hypothetical protein
MDECLPSKIIISFIPKRLPKANSYRLDMDALVRYLHPIAPILFESKLVNEYWALVK